MCVCIVRFIKNPTCFCLSVTFVSSKIHLVFCTSVCKKAHLLVFLHLYLTRSSNTMVNNQLLLMLIIKLKCILIKLEIMRFSTPFHLIIYYLDTLFSWLYHLPSLVPLTHFTLQTTLLSPHGTLVSFITGYELSIHHLASVLGSIVSVSSLVHRKYCITLVIFL